MSYAASVNMIRNKINELPLNCQIIQPSCFSFLFDETEEYHFNYSELRQLSKGIKKYLNICTLKDLEHIEKEIQHLGHSFHRLTTEVHLKHVRMLQVLELIFSSKPSNDKINMNTLKCNGNIEEVLKVAKVVKIACEQDLNAFTFLSQYLQRCAFSLSSNKCHSVKEVQSKITEIVTKLKDQHPPNQDRPDGTNVTQIKSFKVKEKMKNITINLQDFSPEERNNKLTAFILEMANLANANLGELIDITKDACSQNSGIQYKTGVKVSNIKEISSINRVKQKLLSGKFKKNQILECSLRLGAFLKEEKEAYHQQLNHIFMNSSGPIQFTVSDMVRGKCMFRQISEINAAANQIIKKCQQNGYRIQEIDNRLSKPTTDLVFKIQIKGIISEFQLAYQFNVVKNEFNHKLYELIRSKFFTVLSTTSEYNQRMKQTLREYYKMGQAVQRMNKEIRVIMKNNQVSNVKYLAAQFRKWLGDEDLFKVSKEQKKILKLLKHLQIDFTSPEDDKKVLKSKCLRKFQVGLSLSVINKVNKKLRNIEIQEKVDLLKRQSKGQARRINSSIGGSRTQVKRRNSQISGITGTLFFGTFLGQQEEGQRNKKAINLKSLAIQILKLTDRKSDRFDAAIYSYLNCLFLKHIGNCELAIRKAENCETQLKVSTLQKYKVKLKYLKAELYAEKKATLKQLQTRKQILSYFSEDSLEKAQCFKKIGSVYAWINNYEQSLKYFELSLELLKKLKMENNMLFATTMMQKAIPLSKQGHYQNAKKICHQALVKIQALKGKQTLQYGECLLTTGQVYNRSQNSLAAYKFSEQAFHIQLKLEGRNSKNVALSLKFMGGSASDHDMGVKHLKQSLEIAQRAEGITAYNCVHIYNFLGTRYFNAKEYQTAIKYYLEGYELMKQFYNDSHYLFAAFCNNLANAYGEIKEYQEAIKYVLQAVNIYKNSQSGQVFQCVNLLTNLASKYLLIHNYHKARDYTLESLEFAEKVRGKHCIQAYRNRDNLGNIYKELRKYKDSAQQKIKSIEIIHNMLKSQNNLQCAKNYQQAGQSCYLLEDFQQGLSYTLKSLEIYQQLGKSKDSQQITECLRLIGLIYAQLQQYQLALQKCDQSLDNQEAEKGKDNEKYLECLRAKGLVLCKMKDYQKSLQILQQSLQQAEKLNDTKQSMLYSTTLQDIAKVYESKQDYQKALQCYHESIAIRLSLIGKASIQYADTLVKIAKVQIRSGDKNSVKDKLKQAKDTYIDFFKDEDTPDYKQVVQLIRSLE